MTTRKINQTEYKAELVKENYFTSVVTNFVEIVSITLVLLLADCHLSHTESSFNNTGRQKEFSLRIIIRGYSYSFTLLNRNITTKLT